MNNTLFLKFHEKLAYLKEKEYIFALVTYHIAPTITALKPASIITLRNSERADFNLWVKYKIDFLNLYSIECIEIKREDEECILMFYNEKLLLKLLSGEKIAGFLNKFGYRESFSLEDKLLHLKSRFLNNCPHEMGIFLGFPLEDVENFIEDPSKECLMVGHWKVYSNLDKAKEIFDAFDRSKDIIMSRIIEEELRLTN